MYLTFKAKITTDNRTKAILNNLCFSATKLYNTINYYLRNEWAASISEYKMNCTQYKNYEHHFGYDCLPYGKPKVPLYGVKSMFKDNHWAKNMYSQSAQAVVEEVINAYKSWFALRRNGHKDANPPKFRPKTNLSPVTFKESSIKLSTKNKHSLLRLSLGIKREDKLRTITVRVSHHNPLPEGVLKNVQITYDTVTGTYYAHLVFDVPTTSEQLQLFPTNVVAFVLNDGIHPFKTETVDLGLNNLITATFTDGTACIISGRELKAIRRYWQKVRAKVKPPSVTKRKPSRRYNQICRKESRQIRHRLHIISKEFVKLCAEKCVTNIVFGD